MGTTPGGLPYPEPTAPVTAGADDIKALALALDGAGSLYAHVRHQLANGVSGGASIAGWNTRPLNVEVEDFANILALAANRVTLSAGIYRVRAYSVIWATGSGQLRLRNITDNATILTGLSVNSQVNTAAPLCFLDGRFTIAAAKALELQQWCTNAQAGTNGLGFAVTSGEPEIFAELEFWKIG